MFLFWGGGGRYRAVYETMWKNIVESERPQMTIWMRISCWIPKASNINTEYVVLIFHCDNFLYESTSVLHSTYIACLVIVGNIFWEWERV
jgi:hypothetical protein